MTQIVDVPVGLLNSATVPIDASLQVFPSGAHIDIITLRKIHVAQSAHLNRLVMMALQKNKIRTPVTGFALIDLQGNAQGSRFLHLLVPSNEIQTFSVCNRGQVYRGFLAIGRIDLNDLVR